MGSGDRLGDSGQRFELLSVVLEAVPQHADFQCASLVLSGDGRSGQWEARIELHGGLCCPFRHGGYAFATWRRCSHIGIDREFFRPSTGPFAQVAFGIGLQPPGDFADQVRLVARSRFFTEDVRLPLAEFPGRHLLQRSDFILNVHGNPLWLSELFRSR
mgnify:CR=1 FL=1